MNENQCITNLLKFILLLQKNSKDNNSSTGCDKPYLGPLFNNICYNTRPISIYNKNGQIFTFSNNEITYSRFRVEKIQNNNITLRALDYSNNNYTATNNFITVNPNCICAIRCYSDTFITNL